MTHPIDNGSAGEEQLRAYLVAGGLNLRIIEPGVPMPTVPLAATATGVEPERIIKSVVFASTDGRLVLGIASGTARIDRARLAAVRGHAKLKLASPEAVLAATGYPAGGVAPIGHRTPIPVVVDRRVMELDRVFGGGGSERTLLEIGPACIVALTGASVADIVVPESAAVP